MGQLFAKAKTVQAPKSRTSQLQDHVPQPPPPPQPDIYISPTAAMLADIPPPFRSAMQNHPRYALHAMLGQGGYGVVLKAWDKLGKQYVAIKFVHIVALKRSSNAQRIVTLRKRMKREICYHQRLSGHPHIIGFKQVFVAREFLCIVMELAKGGDLLRRLNSKKLLNQQFNEEEARQWFQQLILGVSCIQSAGLVNRDLKLENLLIQQEGGNEVLKLCDFGFAKHIEDDSRAVTQAGSQPYMAPEVFYPQDFQNSNSQQRDIWSCGVILYCLLFHKFPFSPKACRNVLQFINNVRYARFTFPQDSAVSDAAKSLIRRMLTPNPSQRITLKQVMKNKWFRTNFENPQQSGGKIKVGSSMGRSENMQFQEETEIQQLVDDIFDGKQYQRANWEDQDIDRMILMPTLTSESYTGDGEIAG